jgi:hypothetical protein
MYGHMIKVFEINMGRKTEGDSQMIWNTLYKIIKSTNSQLEFLTLLGIILNGVMTGYVTQNTIYRFLVVDAEKKLYAACGTVKAAEAGETSLKDARLFQFHSERMKQTLEQIAF